MSYKKVCNYYTVYGCLPQWWDKLYLYIFKEIFSALSFLTTVELILCIINPIFIYNPKTLRVIGV